MKRKILSIISIITIFTMIGCGNKKTNYITDNKSETTNTDGTISSETQSTSISIEKINEILTSKNKDIIDTYGLSEKDRIQMYSRSNFYEPVFSCDKLGVLIGFDSNPNDSIETIKVEDKIPNLVIPIDGTIIKFNKNIDFKVGDNMSKFEEKFGKGTTGEDINLKGDKEFKFISYNINNLEIKFKSLTGEDFYLYTVYISNPN